MTLDVVDFQFAHEGYSWITFNKLTIFDDNMLLRQRVIKQLGNFAPGNCQTRNDSEILIQFQFDGFSNPSCRPADYQEPILTIAHGSQNHLEGLGIGDVAFRPEGAVFISIHYTHHLGNIDVTCSPMVGINVCKGNGFAFQ